MRFIEWSNGMVMAFGEDGKQCEYLQGTKEDVEKKVKANGYEKEWNERELMDWHRDIRGGQ